MKTGIVGASFGVLLLMTAATNAESPSECVAAARWVEEHVDDLPSTLGEFSKYSIRFKRAIYAELQPAVRLSLWREHFRYHSVRTSLTISQSMFLAEAVVELDRYFGARSSRAKLHELADRARAAFGVELAKQFFVALGESGLAELAGPKPDKALAYCDCSVESDWCNTQACAAGGCCTVAEGCGWLMEYECDGLCRDAC